MTDDELDDRLRAAGIARRPAEYWQAFPQRVLKDLPPGAPQEPSLDRLRPTWPAAIGMGVAALLILGLFLRTARNETRAPDAYAALKDLSAVREVCSMFPHQVQALIGDAGEIHLVLSEHPDVPASTPLLIEIQHEGSLRTAVTFSGQNLQIAGERVEVLANLQGEITLVGDRVFWSSRTPRQTTAGLQIRARALAAL